MRSRAPQAGPVDLVWARGTLRCGERQLMDEEPASTGRAFPAPPLTPERGLRRHQVSVRPAHPRTHQHS